MIGKDTVTSKFTYDGTPGKNQFCYLQRNGDAIQPKR